MFLAVLKDATHNTMKRIFLMLILALTFMQMLQAQDIIITKQSERIDAKVIEVSETEVKYKKQNNSDGPAFVIKTSKISSIIYANGEVQLYYPEQPLESIKKGNKAIDQIDSQTDRQYTQDNGMQFSSEIQWLNGLSGAFVPSYKINKLFSIGMGFTIGNGFVRNVHLSVDDYESCSPIGDASIYFKNSFRVFIRTDYRILKYRVSPIASVDVGVMFNRLNGVSTSYTSYSNGITYENPFGDYDDIQVKNTIFVALSFGVSWKMTDGSYLQLKSGYAISPDAVIVGNRFVKNKSSIIVTESGNKNPSAFFISLGLTCTI